MIYLATADRSLQYSSGDHVLDFSDDIYFFRKNQTNTDFFGKDNVFF